MSWFFRLTTLLLLITTPTLMLNPAIAAASTPVSESASDSSSDFQKAIEDVPIVTYDQMMDVIDALDEDELDGALNDQELENLLRFIVYVTNKGALFTDAVDRDELEHDSEELLSASDPYDLFSDWSIASASPRELSNDYEVLLCKKKKSSWVAKKFKQVKKYVCKHKTAFIIGAVVVVAATAVVCVAVGTAASTAGAATLGEAGAAAATGMADSHHDRQKEKPKEPIKEERVPEPFSKAVDAQIDSFIDQGVVEDKLTASTQSSSLVDTARFAGAGISHDIVDGFFEYSSYIPKILDATNNSIAKSPSEVFQEGRKDFSFEEGYQKVAAEAHAIIDRLFSTNQAELYTSEAKERNDKFTVGFLPLPGSSGAKRILPSQANNVRGWKVGQDINNRTITGRVPKWSAVRQRYWKNEAYFNPEKYPGNVDRMKKGLAPQRFNEDTGLWESMELHHTPPQRDGGLFDVIKVWPDEHAELDSFRKLGK